MAASAAGKVAAGILLLLLLLMFFLVFSLNASAAAPTFRFGQRKLTSTTPPIDDQSTTNRQVSPTVSPVNHSDAVIPPQKQNNNNTTSKTLPDATGKQINNHNATNSTVPNKHDDHVKSSDFNTSAHNQNATNTARNKDHDHVNSSALNGTRIDQGKGLEANATTKPLSGNNATCEGSLISCRDKEMAACIEPSKDGSKELFILVLNGGENTLKVNVSVPDPSRGSLLVFEVPKRETKRMHIESANVGNSTNLLVNSENAKCRLPLVHPVSVDYYIQQLSFYSRQVTPIYGASILFVLGVLFGGTWACCKFRKKSRQDGIPYQELEMGLPESVNVDDAAEGWDHDWDDDWDDENAVRSPGGNQVRSNISADGLTSRSPAKLDGWENDWDD